jgi:hypothetical protein
VSELLTYGSSYIILKVFQANGLFVRRGKSNRSCPPYSLILKKICLEQLLLAYLQEDSSPIATGEPNFQVIQYVDDNFLNLPTDSCQLLLL